MMIPFWDRLRCRSLRQDYADVFRIMVPRRLQILQQFRLLVGKVTRLTRVFCQVVDLPNCRAVRLG